jgi:hypothetical protein
MTSTMLRPDVVLVRVSVTSPGDSATLIDRVRARCHGRDWSGPRDLLIGTVGDDCFGVRRPLAFQTPVRCIVRGEVTPAEQGSVVVLHFGPQAFPVLVFWFIPFILPIPTSYRFATMALFVVIAFALFVRELRVTRRLIECLLGAICPEA